MTFPKMITITQDTVELGSKRTNPKILQETAREEEMEGQHRIILGDITCSTEFIKYIFFHHAKNLEAHESVTMVTIVTHVTTKITLR
jgi:hypothetical protein